MSSTKQKARAAGWVYVLLVITGVFSLLIVRNAIYVPGSVVDTANNIASSELLFRAGILVGGLAQIIYVLVALALYRLLEDVDRSQAILMVTFAVIGGCVGFANQLNQLATLILLSGGDVLSVFSQAELQAAAYLFLRLHDHGLQALQIFWGLWLLPFGALVYKSRFIPKVFGILLGLAGGGYLIDAVTDLLVPQYGAVVSRVTFPLTLGELAIVVWLVVKGAKDEP